MVVQQRPSPHASAVGVCVLAFLVLSGYAIARPATESLFLEAHGSASLPLVWAAVAATVVVVVTAYNAAAARMPLPRVIVGAIAASALSLVLLAALLSVQVPGTVFALYVWKDVHIVVLIEALWSIANLVFSERAARWLYGLFCACGAIGGVCGNLAVGELAARYGTGQTLWFGAGVFVLQVAAAVWLGRAAGRPRPERRSPPKMGDGLQVLRRSPYLGWLLGLVGIVQVVITLVDYQYNVVIEAAFPLRDQRTAIIGQVYAVIDGSSLVLQLGTGFVLRWVGLRWTLLGIPVLLGAALASFVAVPRFALMALVKVASKAFDYSLFRAAKEILYIPLSYAEKTRGKALVDMLTYRVSKGATSILLAAILALGLELPIALVALLLVGAWGIVTVGVMRRHAALVRASGAGRGDERASD